MRRSYELLWDWGALVTFRSLPLHTEMMIARAAVRFAERGEGHVEWAAPYHRLRAGFYDLALSVDSRSRVMTVVRIYRAR